MIKIESNLDCMYNSISKINFFKSKAAFAIAAGVFLSASAPQMADKKSSENHINLYSEINHPFVFKDTKTGEYTGIAYEMVQLLLNKSGLKADITVAPWRRAKRMNDTDLNSCLFIMNRTTAREMRYRWVGPLVLSGLAIYKAPNRTFKAEKISDLKGLLVTGKSDGVAVTLLKSEVDVKLLTTPTDRQAANLFYKGRVDLWAAGKIDAPLEAKALGQPRPEVLFSYKDVDLSIGCNLGLDYVKYERLVKAFNDTKNERQQILDRYLSITAVK